MQNKQNTRQAFDKSKVELQSLTGLTPNKDDELIDDKAAHSTIIATSGFTQQAIKWAKGKPMSLHDGDKFISMWQ